MVPDSGKVISLKFDSLLFISSSTLDSIILSSVFIPEGIRNGVDNGCEGRIYYEFKFRNKTQISADLKRGINPEIDAIIKPQFQKIFDIVRDKIQTDTCSLYKIVFPIEVRRNGNVDSIYFREKNIYDPETIHNLFFRLKEPPMVDMSMSFNPKNLKNLQIPVNLEECIKQIDLLLDSATKEKAKKWSEEDFGAYTHMFLGMWIRNNWRLWGDSTLSQYFNKMGIFHPDDMSGIILDSYHRTITGEKIRLKEQVKHYQDYWKDVQKKNFDRYKVGETIDYKYSLGFISDQQEADYKSKKCLVKGKIISKNEKKLLIEVELTNDCNNEGAYYLDIDLLKKLEKKNLLEDELRKKVVKTMKIGDKKWFYYWYWKY
jgi:hypothetical protein